MPWFPVENVLSPLLRQEKQPLCFRCFWVLRTSGVLVASGGLPLRGTWSAPASLVFGACSAFTHVTARSLAESHSDPFHPRLRQPMPPLGLLPAGKQLNLPGGTCTHWETRPLHGARRDAEALRSGARLCLPNSETRRPHALRSEDSASRLHRLIA